MSLQKITFEYYIQQGKAVLFRCYGDSPCITIPAQLNGVPVAEILPYCFSEKTPTLPKETEILRWGKDISHPICGNFIQQIVFSKGLEKIGAFAFYNCRNLNKITLPSSVQQIEGDAFMNCHLLQLVEIQGSITQPSPLRQIGWRIQHLFVAQFLEASVVFPEYYEDLEENTPAHVFNHKVVGIGYRYRCCFQGEVLDLSEYDKTLEQASAEEAEKPICHLALVRLTSKLLPANTEGYSSYLQKHLQTALYLSIEQANHLWIEWILENLKPEQKDIVKAREVAQKKGDAVLVSLLTIKSTPKTTQFDF